jgi:hypothetical protein
MDSGEIEVFNAYRVQHNNSRGPFKVIIARLAGLCQAVLQHTNLAAAAANAAGAAALIIADMALEQPQVVLCLCATELLGEKGFWQMHSHVAKCGELFGGMGVYTTIPALCSSQ